MFRGCGRFAGLMLSAFVGGSAAGHHYLAESGLTPRLGCDCGLKAEDTETRLPASAFVLAATAAVKTVAIDAQRRATAFPKPQSRKGEQQ